MAGLVLDRTKSGVYRVFAGFFLAALAFASKNTTSNRALRQDAYGYAPFEVDCPNPRPAIRNSMSMSREETSWVEKRRNNTVWAIRNFVSRANISGFDTDNYMDKIAENSTTLPNIAIAMSGGGWRALMNGAGALAAYDNRTTNSTSPGQAGGLLQAATYLTGLSGGSWLVGSLYVPQLRSVEQLYRMDPNASDSLWQFDHSIIQGPVTLSTTEYYGTITDEIQNKENAGFNTTITDLWGRGLSFQLFNTKDGGPNYTFSSLGQNPDFQSGQVPLPIIVAIERTPNQLLILANSSVYEINPWEIGTFDSPTAAFASLQFVGSNFSGGVVPDNQSCVSGFDNMGFVVGTSSSLFNQAYLQVNKTNAPARVVEYVSGKLEQVGNQNSDVSDWVNPFYRFHPEVNTNANSRILSLVDGGEDLQNIPLHPLLQTARKVDVIFAVDSSADTAAPGANWPNGTSLVATYQRSLLESGRQVPFPAVPDQNTFINLGLNSRPTFFGCDASNLTQPAPLIVYIPNSPYTYHSNISTFQMETNDTERNSIIQNGYNVATMANGTIDKEWPACIGCAILTRSFWKTQTEMPTTCQNCFARYCWNGTTNSTAPTPYAPTPAVKASGSAKRRAIASAPVVGSFLCLFIMVWGIVNI
ncbi:lysophospholipase catalytic domain-domain-containing protein [Clohesyomyces aquaticus]|uniref:Lysophospholipase n=1 Tax=Clohesyomyces aquaticus TaxID=1231657 RepID=A0A1Y1YL07_9PLEO|nr:lysophospholipase catalytic domain-domain-containing protein [Clohesyomyces aquaticus]